MKILSKKKAMTAKSLIIIMLILILLFTVYSAISKVIKNALPG